MNETEQPILDLTESQDAQEITPSNNSLLNMDFSTYDLGLGF